MIHTTSLSIDLFIHSCAQILTTLDLEGNSIGTEGAEHLVNALQQNQVTSLTLLYLSVNYVSNISLQTLTSLSLKANAIGYDISRRIDQMLNNNTQLT